MTAVGVLQALQDVIERVRELEKDVTLLMLENRELEVRMTTLEEELAEQP